MKIISFSNFKGGVGKSSSSLCVAYSLVNRGHKVLLIDADSQANLSLSLGLDKNSDSHIGNFILGEKPFNQVAKKINNLLQIIPSSLKVQVYEKMLSAENEYQYFLKERLEDVNSFDYLIIDTPPALNSFTFASLVASDYLFIPAQPEIFGVEGLTTILDTVERLKKRSNKNLKIGGIFFTKYAKSYRKRIHHDLVDGLKENYGDLIMNTTIRDNVSIAESQALKESIYNYAPQSNGAKDYDALTSEILERINCYGWHKKTKSFAGLVKPTHTLSDFDKEMVGMNENNEVQDTIEVHELNADNELTPFSTRISKGTYMKVRQYEYWERATITEIVELALVKFLEDKESAIRPLPEKELKRLEALSKKKKKGLKK